MTGSESEIDIFTSDDIKFYYTGKLQDFTARYIIKNLYRNENKVRVTSSIYMRGLAQPIKTKFTLH